MKRRTEGKEAEINAKLPFVRDLVRRGHAAQRQGDSGLALASYAAAYEQIPLLFSIGVKADRVARLGKPGTLPVFTGSRKDLPRSLLFKPFPYCLKLFGKAFPNQWTARLALS